MERPQTLAGAIKELRHRYGSHDKMANAIGTTRNTVIQWEKGRKPRPQFHDALAAAGVPAELLSQPDEDTVEDRLIRIEARQVASAQNQVKLARSLTELTKAVDAVNDLIEDAFAESRLAPKRRRQAS